MSLRLEMLQVARLAPTLLAESTPLVSAFVTRQQHAAGGFVDRSGQPDLYYTVFGLEGLAAVRADTPAARVRPFLESFGDGADLDFVHLACLARAWASLRDAPNEDFRGRLASRLAGFRSRDGGFNADAGADEGTAYAAFVALGAHQDLGAPVPDPDALAASVRALDARDGGVSNLRGAAKGMTPPTAAAIAVLRQLDAPIPGSYVEWLLRHAHPQGGFVAGPGVPMPDLLSTATAIHALVSMHASIDPLKEACLDFVDSLWNSRGGFHGHWADDEIDCEYTYYGLLALGHLSL
ncbi:MAG: prenyltransferase/squalene oxidase repeat-containing protein [Vicinamibacterales bacterium]